MNDLRKAAEMALEALEIWEKMQPNTSASAVRVPAIQALRQALAKQDNHESLRKAAWDRIAELEEALEKAVLAEREACAKVCEELVLAYVGNASATANQCAEAIRARGEK